MDGTITLNNLYTEANIQQNLQEIYSSISTWPSWKVDSMYDIIEEGTSSVVLSKISVIHVDSK